MGLFILHLVLCFIFASVGSGRSLGYWGTFFVSLILTPLLGIIIALASGKEYKHVCALCKKVETSSNQVQSEYCPSCGKNKYGLTLSEMTTRIRGEMPPVTNSH